MEKRVSLRDVARAVNLSHATVSLALRNHPSIAVKTRQRIQAMAQSLGYRPDPLLRALAEYRRDKLTPRYQSTLAWLNYYPQPEKMDAITEFVLYHQGAQERAAELGYRMETFTPVADRLSSEKLKKILLARGVQGILLPPQPEPNTVLDFDFSDFAAVTFGFSMISPRLHVIAGHMFYSCVYTFQKLRSYGFRRIGFVTSDWQNRRLKQSVLGGFLASQEELPVKDRIPPVFHQEVEYTATTFKTLLPWFRKYRPDVIITHFVELPALMRAHQIPVPEKVSLALLAVPPNDSSWAGINQNGREVGRSAVDMVAGMLYHSERGVPALPKCIFIEGFWQDGGTVLPRRGM